ncbi:MAG: hypothetical protein ACRDNS_01080, partial [Trebonia sp.]
MTWWMWLIVVAVVAAALLACWLSWTAGRLDRIHLRYEAAHHALLSQANRRIAIAAELASGGLTDPASALLVLDAVASARAADGDSRWQAEGDLTEALHAVSL